VSEILAQVQGQGLPTSEAPFLIYLTAIQTLRTCEKADEAQKVLSEAQALISKRAEQITDPNLRRKFLENVPENRVILNFNEL